MPTSVGTPAATFVSLPMGRLDDPLDTFWQLLVRPAGTTEWTNQVAATGVATNGGILFSPAGRSVLASARPSNLLGFTPIELTSDGGRHWAASGLVPVVVGPGPNAVSTDGAARLAISADGSQVLEQASSGASWATAVTVAALRAAVPSCDPAEVTAAAWSNGQPVLGLACRHAGAGWLVTRSASGWEAVGAGVTGGPVTVLGLAQRGPNPSALLSVAGRGGLQLVEARWGGTGTALALDGPVRSFGSAYGSGWFAVVLDRRGAQLAYVNDGSGSGWRALPNLPPGTVTIATGDTTDSYVDAFAVDGSGTVLTIWRLGAQGDGWVPAQTIKVPVPFGSSD